VPFGFLKRTKRGTQGTASGPEPGTVPGGPAPASGQGGSPGGGRATGPVRGIAFAALTEDWRLAGRMDVAGRLSDALNRREAIAIHDVKWGPTDGSAPLEPAPGLRSVDPYDLILVITGDESLPPLTDNERSALKVHKVAYDVALEAPPYRVIGTVYLHPGSEPERLMERSTEMFVPVVDAVARLGSIEVSDPEVEVILVNRFYLRGVEQVDKRTGERHAKLPGQPMGGTSWQERSR
jgi:hypothetical protein